MGSPAGLARALTTMSAMRTLIVGHGGREAILGSHMARSSTLHAFVAHPNPTLLDAVARSGGTLHIGDVRDADAVAAFADAMHIDLAMVSADEPLAAGVVDALTATNVAAVGPTRAGAEIEWNKAFSRRLLDRVAPDANPECHLVRTPGQARQVIDAFGDRPVAVKPQGLTGGKGVKVMGPHLADHDQAGRYAESLIAADGLALIEEKITGVEFTIQAISDGQTTVFPAVTYDYPYRYDGDSGPGTGGMGSFSHQQHVPPFLTLAEYERACEIVRLVIDALQADDRHFNGVMNSGFFAAAAGIKVIEFNARFGDPECLNIMSMMRSDWVAVMQAISARQLHTLPVQFAAGATLASYAVSPDYAQRSGPSYPFAVHPERAPAGVSMFFASAQAGTEPHRYHTVGSSRSVALAVLAPTLTEARQYIETAHRRVLDGPLEHRSEIGSADYVQALVCARHPAGHRPRRPRERRPITVVGASAREYALLSRLREEGAPVYAAGVAPGSPHALIADAHAPLALPADVAAAGAACRSLHDGAAVLCQDERLAFAGLGDTLGDAAVMADRRAAQIERDKLTALQTVLAGRWPHLTAPAVAYDPCASYEQEMILRPRFAPTRGLLASSADPIPQWVAQLPVFAQPRMTGPAVTMYRFAGAGGVWFSPLIDVTCYAGSTLTATAGMSAAIRPERQRMDVTDIRELLDDIAGRYGGLPVLGVELLLTDDGPKVVEFDCRLGNPETSALLAVLDGGLSDWVIDGTPLAWSSRAALSCVCVPDARREPLSLAALAGLDVTVDVGDLSLSDGRAFAGRHRPLTLTTCADDMAAARHALRRALERLPESWVFSEPGLGCA